MKEYTLVRTRRRTVAIYIKPDATVEVRAPFSASRSKIDEFVRQKRGWIERKTAEIREAGKNQTVLTPEQEMAYKREARDRLFVRTRELAAQTGLMPTEVKLSNAAKRWGSCSAQNRINLSWRLVLLDQALIDYVIIHELCHIREHNHSGAFWALVARFMPDYQERRKRLRTFYA